MSETAFASFACQRSGNNESIVCRVRRDVCTIDLSNVAALCEYTGSTTGAYRGYGAHFAEGTARGNGTFWRLRTIPGYASSPEQQVVLPADSEGIHPSTDAVGGTTVGLPGSAAALYSPEKDAPVSVARVA